MEHGYLYPDFGHTQHLALVQELSRRAGSTVDFPPLGKFGPYARHTDFLEQRKGKSPHTSIISSELFFQRPGSVPGLQGQWGNNDYEVLKKTVAETAKYFDGCDVKVLVYLRRQDNWLMSIYNESIKVSNYSKSFEEFSEKTIGARFLRIIQMWIAHFGRKNVICHSYDSIIKNKCNIVNDFLETVCPDIQKEKLNLANNQKNPSLSNEALWVKKQINKICSEEQRQLSPKNRNELMRTLEEITRTSLEPGRPLLNNAKRQALMEKYLPGNKRLIEELRYSELESLVDLSDLVAPTEKTEILSRPPHETYRLAVEKMIRSLL